MTELQLQTEIIKVLKKHLKGAVIWKTNDAMLNGVPDLYVAYNGKSYHFEIKAPGKKVDPKGIQAYWLKRLRANGIIADEINDIKKIKKYFNLK